MKAYGIDKSAPALAKVDKAREDLQLNDLPAQHRTRRQERAARSKRPTTSHDLRKKHAGRASLGGASLEDGAVAPESAEPPRWGCVAC